VSIVDHLGLFKAEWIGDPERLKTLARESRYNDLFTAEIAAWCAEIHAHLRDLEAEVGVELILMGGNAASLRFDAVKQRGSRDNDYLTLASHADIQRLMDAFAERFAALHPLFLPSVYEPKRPAKELDLVTYVIPVALRLDHGRASNNTVKVEFHFETDLPPAETLSGSIGPTRQAILARVPELPYQFVLKLMTLASPPVGIDENRRQDAVPRQLYDLDLLLAAFTLEGQWRSMVGYCAARYARECAHWKARTAQGEPSASIQQRLARWADCIDPASECWRTIRAVQQSQLRREVHRGRWGWRARCLRLATAAQCVELEDGWKTWQQALATAVFVPAVKARHFKGALAELTGEDVKTLPLELHDFVWDALSAGEIPIDQRVANAHAILSAVPPQK
jgi:hypothetical protein